MYRAKCNEFLPEFDGYLRIFTDGSKTGKAVAAAAILAPRVCIKRLPDNSSSLRKLKQFHWHLIWHNYSCLRATSFFCYLILFHVCKVLKIRTCLIHWFMRYFLCTWVYITLHELKERGFNLVFIGVLVMMMMDWLAIRWLIPLQKPLSTCRLPTWLYPIPITTVWYELTHWTSGSNRGVCRLRKSHISSISVLLLQLNQSTDAANSSFCNSWIDSCACWPMNGHTHLPTLACTHSKEHNSTAILNRVFVEAQCFMVESIRFLTPTLVPLMYAASGVNCSLS